MDANEEKFRSEYAEIAERMTDASLFGTPEMVKLAKRQSEITPLIDLYDRRAKVVADLQSSKEALDDPELAELARDEIPELEQELDGITDQLRVALVPKDPAD